MKTNLFRARFMCALLSLCMGFSSSFAMRRAPQPRPVSWYLNFCYERDLKTLKKYGTREFFKMIDEKFDEMRERVLDVVLADESHRLKFTKLCRDVLAHEALRDECRGAARKLLNFLKNGKPSEDTPARLEGEKVERGVNFYIDYCYGGRDSTTLDEGKTRGFCEFLKKNFDDMQERFLGEVRGDDFYKARFQGLCEAVIQHENLADCTEVIFRLHGALFPSEASASGRPPTGAIKRHGLLSRRSFDEGRSVSDRLTKFGIRIVPLENLEGGRCPLCAENERLIISFCTTCKDKAGACFSCWKECFAISPDDEVDPTRRTCPFCAFHLNSLGDRFVLLKTFFSHDALDKALEAMGEHLPTDRRGVRFNVPDEEEEEEEVQRAIALSRQEHQRQQHREDDPDEELESLLFHVAMEESLQGRDVVPRSSLRSSSAGLGGFMRPDLEEDDLRWARETSIYFDEEDLMPARSSSSASAGGLGSFSSRSPSSASARGLGSFSGSSPSSAAAGRGGLGFGLPHEGMAQVNPAREIRRIRGELDLLHSNPARRIATLKRLKEMIEQLTNQAMEKEDWEELWRLKDHIRLLLQGAELENLGSF